MTLIGAVALVSCGEKAEVKWPELNSLDDLSVKVEQAALVHDHETQNQLLENATVIIADVIAHVPENAQNPEQLAVLLKDLAALSDEIEKKDTLGHDELDSLAQAIHPVVALIMETSGVPHVHENPLHTSDHGDEHGHHDHHHDH